jgi:hypothetical protein
MPQNFATIQSISYKVLTQQFEEYGAWMFVNERRWIDEIEQMDGDKRQWIDEIE